MVMFPAQHVTGLTKRKLEFLNSPGLITRPGLFGTPWAFAEPVRLTQRVRRGRIQGRTPSRMVGGHHLVNIGTICSSTIPAKPPASNSSGPSVGGFVQETATTRFRSGMTSISCPA